MSTDKLTHYSCLTTSFTDNTRNRLVRSLPITKAGNCYILAHICYTTRYLIAKPTCTSSTDDIIHTIENDLIWHYGPPLTYISDNATSFSSHKLNSFFNKYGITHFFTPPYTPQANGLIEANATIIAVFSKFSLEFSDDWDHQLPNLILSINTSKQSSTQYSPFFLLHGYEPRIPDGEVHLGTIIQEISRLEQLNKLIEYRSTTIENLKQIQLANYKGKSLLRSVPRATSQTAKDLSTTTTELSIQDLPVFNINNNNSNKNGPFQFSGPIDSRCRSSTPYLTT